MENSEIMAQAIESAFVSYKENDTDTIGRIFKGAVLNIRENEKEYIRKENFNGIKLSARDKSILMNARMKFYIKRMAGTFSAIIEDYEQKKMETFYDKKKN